MSRNKEEVKRLLKWLSRRDKVVASRWWWWWGDGLAEDR